MAKLLKRLLQHRETKQYFVRDGEWTSDPEKATHFESLREAHTQAVQSGLEETCRLALRFEGTEVDVGMTL